MAAVTNATSTVTFTATHTTTVQAAPFLLFGLPPELVGLFAIVAVIMVYAVLKYNVKGVPVQLLWIYKNGSALLMRSKEDMQGIFLEVMNARGKKLETLKKPGLALPVKVMPDKFTAYVEMPKNTTMQDSTLVELRSKGFKISPAKQNRKGVIKAYLIEKESKLTEALAYLDVSLGGLKTMRLYGAVEGAGETFNWQDKIDAAKSTDPGNTAVIHEMRSAFKSFAQILADAVKGTFSALLIPLIMGISLGGMLTVILLLVSGHMK